MANFDDDGVDLRSFDARMKQGEPALPRKIAGSGASLLPEKDGEDDVTSSPPVVDDVDVKEDDALAPTTGPECEQMEGDDGSRWKNDRHQYSK